MPTPPEVVDVMLDLAAVRADDIVYDLGCGDGRVVIAAAKRGARGVCVENDPRLIVVASVRARAEGVVDRIRFVGEDLTTTSISDATVVMLYLSQRVNLAVRPRLRRDLAPGTRVVSHWHDMGDWTPDKTVRVRADGWVRPVYLWSSRR